MMAALALVVLLQQAPPAEYAGAEKAARTAIEALGVPTDGVRVVYDPTLPANVNGEQRGNVIRINPARFPESVKSVFHEFWHYFQQTKVGGERRFLDEYAKYGNSANDRHYDRNPFEREARIAADVMEHTYRTRNSLVFRLFGAGNYERDVVSALERARPRMESAWETPPEHLRGLGSRPVVRDAPTAGSIIKREAAGLAQFAAAYLLKEGFKAIETGDPNRMRQAVGQLKEPGFWGGVAVFTGAARATEFGLSKLPLAGAAKGLSRAALPLAAGMAAVQVLSGQASLKDVLIDTGAFLAAGLAVNLVADGLIYPILFAAGPPGWIAAGVYTVAKLAVTLYLGEKLGDWIRGLFGGEKTQRAPARDGIKAKIDAISP